MSSPQQFLFKVWLPGQDHTSSGSALTLHNEKALKFFVQAGSLVFPDTPFHVSAYYFTNESMGSVAEGTYQLHREKRRVELYVIQESGISEHRGRLIATTLKAACEQQEQAALRGGMQRHDDDYRREPGGPRIIGYDSGGPLIGRDPAPYRARYVSGDPRERLRGSLKTRFGNGNLTSFGKRIVEAVPPDGISERNLIESLNGLSAYADYQRNIAELVEAGYLLPVAGRYRRAK